MLQSSETFSNIPICVNSLLLDELPRSPTYYITKRPSYTRQFFLKLATQRRRIKSLSSCKGGVTRLQLFWQLATRTIINKMADALSHRHLEIWLAHSDKIALQVAEGMLHASNLSRSVAKSFAKSLATCNATFVALQVARKIASCNMALRNLQTDAC